MEQVKITLDKSQYLVLEGGIFPVIITHEMINTLCWWQHGHTDQPRANSGLPEETGFISDAQHLLICVHSQIHVYKDQDIMSGLEKLSIVRDFIEKFAIPKELIS